MRTGPQRIVQALFGVVLVIFAFMPLFGWEPPPVRPEAQLMQDAIFASGYIIPVILIVYFFVGMSWILGQFVALSSVLLFPISLNIVLFHSLLNRTPASLTAAYALLAVNLFMLYRNRASYRQLFDQER